MSTMPRRSKRNEGPKEIEIEELLNDALVKRPYVVKKWIMSALIEPGTLKAYLLGLYLKELIDEDNRNVRRIPCKIHKGFIDDCGCTLE